MWLINHCFHFCFIFATIWGVICMTVLHAQLVEFSKTEHTKEPTSSLETLLPALYHRHYVLCPFVVTIHWPRVTSILTFNNSDDFALSMLCIWNYVVYMPFCVWFLSVNHKVVKFTHTIACKQWIILSLCCITFWENLLWSFGSFNITLSVFCQWLFCVFGVCFQMNLKDKGKRLKCKVFLIH